MALAVYPLAIPKIAGPGAMLAAVLLTDDDRYNRPDSCAPSACSRGCW